MSAAAAGPRVGALALVARSAARGASLAGVLVAAGCVSPSPENTGYCQDAVAAVQAEFATCALTAPAREASVTCDGFADVPCDLEDYFACVAARYVCTPPVLAVGPACEYPPGCSR